MPDFLESAMMLAFGCAWPASIIKSLKTKSAVGKSLPFLLIVITGYLCGIASKITAGQVNYVLFFYILDLTLVGFDTCLYFRNQKLDRGRASVREIKHFPPEKAAPSRTLAPIDSQKDQFENKNKAQNN